MDTEIRRDAIQEIVAREGHARLINLSEQFGVAPVTIHRDLDHLANLGLLERVRGGARSIGPENPVIKSDYHYRHGHAAAKKQAIALRALREIPEGSTVFLDSSTSVEALAALLDTAEGPSLTVVTNSPAIAFRIHAPSVHVIVTPGELDQQLRAITGRWTAEFLSSLNISTAFVSAAGITPAGLMTTQRELAEVIKAAFARSQRHVALVDSSKFDIPALISMAPLDALDLMITDNGIDAAVHQRYLDAGVPLVVESGEGSEL